MSLNDLQGIGSSDSTRFVFGEPTEAFFGKEYLKDITVMGVQEIVDFSSDPDGEPTEYFLNQVEESRREIEEGKIDSFDTVEETLAFVSSLIDDEKQAKI